MKEQLLALTRDRIAQLDKHLPGARPALGPDDVRDVLVILAGPRTGSSFLFSLLSESGEFISPQGEDTPFFRLHDLGWVESTRESDEIAGPYVPSALRSIASSLLRDVGVSIRDANRKHGVPTADTYLYQAIVRSILQWPLLDFEPIDLVISLRYWVSKCGLNETAWTNWLDVSGIDLGFYEARTRADLPIPSLLLEEPPFILQRPRHIPSAEELRAGTLLLKTSTNVYRIPLLRALFPAARFRWLVLTRNPAASINGLIDGWQSSAFHSHYLKDVAPLRIAGYSESMPGGEFWWKFDLPPGWSEFAGAPLENVCSFQWKSAYNRIVKHMETTADPVLQVKYEELISAGTRESTLQRIFEFAGKTPVKISDSTFERPVMTSGVEHSVRSDRWRRREEVISPLLPDLRDLAGRLGYEDRL